MDLNGLASSRFHRHRRSPSSDRFLAAYPNAPPPPPDNYSSSFTDTNVDELNEDDIFTTDFSHRHHNTPASSSSSPSTPRQQHSSKNSNKSNLQRSELSGILAALPEISGYHRHGHHFYHKASLSTSASSSLSSSSSSRTIPSIPKPPQERIPISSSVGGKYHQSAPVNVPVLSQAMRRRREFDQVDVDDDGEEEGEMLPPHEIVARVSAQSQMLSCSVLEGVGRTLKGRDLRQVRNAIWRRTGFLD